jgi:hypothetical protein
MKKPVYITIGPCPIQSLAWIMQQLDEQTWDVRHVAHAGMGQDTNPAILTKQAPQIFPLFIVVARKYVFENEKVLPPTINMTPPKAALDV